MGYNARNDEIRDNITRMRREWEAQRGALATVRRFNATLSGKGYVWFWRRSPPRLHQNIRPSAGLQMAAGSAGPHGAGPWPMVPCPATKFPAKVWARVWVWTKAVRASADKSALTR